jgi:dienelactone hydrolase
VHVEDIAYDVDGDTMVGTLYVDEPERGARPSVLVCHAGTGLAPFHRERAERIASLGYSTFALDVFGGGRVYPRAAPRAEHGVLRARAAAGLAVLTARPECDPTRVAAVGFCFGGALMIELGRMGADLRAFVGFHPGLALAIPPSENPNIKGPVLMCIGTADPFVPNEERIVWEQQMRDDGVDLRIELYEGVGHVFTDPEAGELGMPGVGYDRRSDERSWAAMLRLFADTIDR